MSHPSHYPPVSRGRLRCGPVGRAPHCGTRLLSEVALRLYPRPFGARCALPLRPRSACAARWTTPTGSVGVAHRGRPKDAAGGGRRTPSSRPLQGAAAQCGAWYLATPMMLRLESRLLQPYRLWPDTPPRFAMRDLWQPMFVGYVVFDVAAVRTNIRVDRQLLEGSQVKPTA